eukprot:4095902-Alexandrium_andersonii.AAC.1
MAALQLGAPIPAGLVERAEASWERAHGSALAAAGRVAPMGRGVACQWPGAAISMDTWRWQLGCGLGACRRGRGWCGSAWQPPVAVGLAGRPGGEIA